MTTQVHRLPVTTTSRVHLPDDTAERDSIAPHFHLQSEDGHLDSLVTVPPDEYGAAHYSPAECENVGHLADDQNNCVAVQHDLEHSNQVVGLVVFHDCRPCINAGP